MCNITIAFKLLIRIICKYSRFPFCVRLISYALGISDYIAKYSLQNNNRNDQYDLNNSNNYYELENALQ